ncbi:hypothetical protein CEXT_360981 [Caerostris extrusa]|uniref:Uncharacterized protein n=1 Tax=Caerostris extrusa TaxID=172846 RepID=A0AAV4TYL0_CAEEX|nr:hypothetical protein CEXT_360981 [Caerostris extrusa]
MKSLPSECIRVENDTVTVKHTFEEVTYTIPDLTTENGLARRRGVCGDLQGNRRRRHFRYSEPGEPLSVGAHAGYPPEGAGHRHRRLPPPGGVPAAVPVAQGGRQVRVPVHHPAAQDLQPHGDHPDQAARVRPETLLSRISEQVPAPGVRLRRGGGADQGELPAAAHQDQDGRVEDGRLQAELRPSGTSSFITPKPIGPPGPFFVVTLYNFGLIAGAPRIFQVSVLSTVDGVPQVPHGGVPLAAVRDAREEDHQDTGHGPGGS